MGLQAKGWADQRVVMYTVDTGDIWPNRSRQIRIVQKRPQPERAETAISSDAFGGMWQPVLKRQVA